MSCRVVICNQNGDCSPLEGSSPTSKATSLLVLLKYPMPNINPAQTNISLQALLEGQCNVEPRQKAKSARTVYLAAQHSTRIMTITYLSQYVQYLKEGWILPCL